MPFVKSFRLALSFLQGKPKWIGIAALLLMGFMPLAIMQTGRDNPVPVGPYLDGAFPPAPAQTGSGNWQAVDAFPNLSFRSPVHIAAEPGSNRLFVAEHNGRIRAFDDNPNASTLTTILDLRTVTYNNAESGLLYFVFHPEYTQGSPYVYVFYQFEVGNNHFSRLSRFTISGSTQVADPNSELVLIHQYDRSRNHNAGSMFFDSQGFLYVSLGDEGGSNNQFNQGQELDGRLFGGVIRIDPEMDPTRSHPIRRQPQQLTSADNSFTANYYIPNDNPWLDPNGAVLEEFVALGLRNPHRMTLDPSSGEAWIADVGQSAREEINLLSFGVNYQWPFREGDVSGPKSTPPAVIGTEVSPLFDYAHSQGNNCIIGGFVYRANLFPSLQGKYLFADNGSKRVWTLEFLPDSSLQQTELLTLPFGSSYYSISSFGQNHQGEIYMLKLHGSTTQGKVFKLTQSQPGIPEPPELLSQTGAFDNFVPMTAMDGLIPYKMKQPFWSDAANKYRWFAVPNNGTHNTADEEIEYAELGEWEWPIGAVWVKHFEMPLDETDPSVVRKLETRFIVKGQSGDIYGITYRWRDDQSDAELLSGARTDTFTVQTANGPREIEWYYPSRGECLSCHNEASGGVLGPKSTQLNCDQYYPLTGRTANQLTTLTHLGMFDNPPDTNALTQLPQIAAIDDPTATLDLKARTYLDANCSSCHQPGTGVQANFDARFETSLANSGIVYGEPINNLGIEGSRLVIPGQPERSTLYLRTAAVHESIAMPPLSKNLLDTAGVALLEAWITQMDPEVTSFSATKDGQRVDFAPIGVQHDSLAQIALSATATSGLGVSYDLIDGPATLSGNTLGLNGQHGFVTVQASRGANNAYHVAPSVTQRFLVAPDSAARGEGLTATYFNDLGLQDSALQRVDEQVNFYWGSTAPTVNMNPLSYSVAWEGFIEAPTSETYEFRTTTDDGVRLWVDGNVVIDAWQDQAATQHTGTVGMTAWEKVPIRLEYFQDRVYGSIKLEWSSASLDPEVVPTFALYPVEGLIDTVITDTGVVDTSTVDTSTVDTSGNDTTATFLNWREDSQLAVYPNVLTRGNATVWMRMRGLRGEEVTVELLDIQGRTHALWNLRGNQGIWERKLNVHTDGPGIYLLRVSVRDKTWTKRLLVR